MLKRILSVMLALVVILAAIPINAAAAEGSLTNFTIRDGYYYHTPVSYSDIYSNEWYAGYVSLTTKYGLLNGVSPDKFSPDTNLKISEAIKLAACMHSIYYNGSSDFVQGTPWYQVYVDYARQNGIISSGFGNYNDYVTRGEFAKILANALPEKALRPRNIVEDNALPDVSISDDYGPAVYKLYRAGVLTGNDNKGTFSPGSFILRREAAAILARMVKPSLRKSVLFLSNEDGNALLKLGENSLSMTAGYTAKVPIYNNSGQAGALKISVEDADIADCILSESEDGSKYLAVYAKSPGSTVINLQMLDAETHEKVIATESISVDVSALDPSDARIEVWPTYDHSVTAGTSKVYTITVVYDKPFTLYIDYNHNYFECDYGDFFDFRSVNLIFTCMVGLLNNEMRKTEISLDLIDKETNMVVATEIIPVWISKTDYYENSFVPNFNFFMHIPYYYGFSDSRDNPIYWQSYFNVENMVDYTQDREGIQNDLRKLALALLAYENTLKSNYYYLYDEYTTAEGYNCRVFYSPLEDQYVAMNMTQHDGELLYSLLITSDTSYFPKRR